MSYSAYKPGQDWQKDKNENVFLKARIKELEEENETLRIEIIEMRNAADVEDEILDEVIDSITDAETWFNQPGETPLHKLI